MAHYVKSVVKEVLDKETGEICTIETSKTWSSKVHDTESFYMVFVNWISLEYQIKSTVAKSILTWMLTNAEYNTGRVLLTTMERSELCKLYGITNNALSIYLKQLKDLNLITGSKGTFFINPEIFWKGELSVRNKLLKDGNITFTISIDQDKKKKK